MPRRGDGISVVRERPGVQIEPRRETSSRWPCRSAARRRSLLTDRHGHVSGSPTSRSSAHLGRGGPTSQVPGHQVRRRYYLARVCEALEAPHAADCSRISVLLANANQNQNLPPPTCSGHVRDRSGTIGATTASPPVGRPRPVHGLPTRLLHAPRDEAGRRRRHRRPRPFDWVRGRRSPPLPGMWHAHYNGRTMTHGSSPIQDCRAADVSRAPPDIRFVPQADVGNGSTAAERSPGRGRA